MASLEPLKERVARKLSKRKKDSLQGFFDIPERFKDGEDAEEDVTAPKNRNARFMNQSVFGMIAAAGSRTDFHSRLDESSESDDEDEGAFREPKNGAAEGTGKATEDREKEEVEKLRRKHTRLLKSLPRLSARTRLSPTPEHMSSSQILPAAAADEDDSDDAATVLDAKAGFMSRMLDARAQVNAANQSSEPEKEQTKEEVVMERSRASSSSSLAARLMEIFKFDAPEEVIAEYPCWLLQSVLLQGYLYITQKHVCFYAYLPKRSNQVIKSGYLSKRGRQNPKYKRHWFILKGDVLSYYTDPGNIYFPAGNIDLRYAISADHSSPDKDSTTFSLTTRHRTYYFRADSHSSAKDWVKHLQKVIFRSHNDGDSVKISLPIDNIIDVEENPVIDFADTLKIRVIDNDETYAIDEYFFSFFSFGQDALDVLRIMIGGNAQHDEPDRRESRSGDGTPREEEVPAGFNVDRPTFSRSDAAPPAIYESVRVTLAPFTVGPGSKRTSGEWRRPSLSPRRSVDEGRRSFDSGPRSSSTSRHSRSIDRLEERSSTSPRPQGSSYSNDAFTYPGPGSSAAVQSLDDTASGSRILQRSDVFQSPTIRRPRQGRTASGGSIDGARRRSQDTTRALDTPEIKVQPPKSGHHEDTPPTDGRHSSYFDSDEVTDDHQGKLLQSTSSSALHGLVQAGTFPIQKASGIAGYLRNRSKHMGNLLATESMGYYEKVSGMWAGGKQHYTDAERLASNDQVDGVEHEEHTTAYGDRFRAHFALPETEKLQATYFANLLRVLPLYGKIYISTRYLCFRSLLPGTRTKMILPLKDIEHVDKATTFRLGWHGLVIIIRGYAQLFFEFGKARDRDDCAITLLQRLDEVKYLEESGLISPEEEEEADAAKAEHDMLQQARMEGQAVYGFETPGTTRGAEPDANPILFDDPRASILNFKPTESLRITCLTIGSRGDVQPYIALCKGLLAEGHKPKIATHREFEGWIRKHGIDFAPVEGDPAELMRICVEYGMFTYSFLREATSKFRGWIDELLASAWKACQNTDLLIESPSAMAGIHIAEALRIPYFRAFSMPWTRTRLYPHAFAVQEHKMGGTYNYMTYVMFDNVFWKAIAGQVNRWRKKELSLHSTTLEKMQPNKVPFLYNFSPSVVVPPLDYSDWIHVTGYWFLDEATGWEPPKELVQFIAEARASGKKLVYIGFGSIVVDDPAALTKTVCDSVVKADVRCILSKGWSDRLGKKDATTPEVPLPEAILQITYSVPHDWLFTQMDAAVHHGGCGTTGASLRAGIPTVIKPFFGDQFFFGQRVEDLGVGVCVKKMNTSVFARSLWQATSNQRIIVKARALGEKIRKEDGVGNAINAVYRDMEYAKSLIKRPTDKTGGAAGGGDGVEHGSEESWTFIGDESDAELSRRIKEWDMEEAMARQRNDENDARRGTVVKGRAAGLVLEKS